MQTSGLLLRDAYERVGGFFFFQAEDGIRDHTVDADGAQYERERGSRREQHHRERPPRERLREKLLHWSDVSDWDLWIHFLYDAPNPGHDGVHLSTRRAYDHPHEDRQPLDAGTLGEGDHREVDDLSRRAVQTVRPHRPGDAGEAIEWRGAIAALHPAPNRFRVRPEPVRERAAHDGTRATEIGLRPVRRTPMQRNSQRLEVAGCHLHHLHAIATIAGGPRHVANPAGAQPRAFQRQLAAEPHRYHAWQRTHARRELLEERARELMRSIAGVRQRH